MEQLYTVKLVNGDIIGTFPSLSQAKEAIIDYLLPLDKQDFKPLKFAIEEREVDDEVINQHGQILVNTDQQPIAITIGTARILDDALIHITYHQEN